MADDDGWTRAAILTTVEVVVSGGVAAPGGAPGVVPGRVRLVGTMSHYSPLQSTATITQGGHSLLVSTCLVEPLTVKVGTLCRWCCDLDSQGQGQGTTPTVLHVQCVEGLDTDKYHQVAQQWTHFANTTSTSTPTS